MVRKLYEFSTPKTQTGLLVASGTYFDSNGTTPCLKVGTFAELDVAASGKKRTRVGEAFLGRRLGDYLR